ncbi:hypothetical protein D6827_03430 [Candidatus Parcubacteria bacterium]|nr:MAG: hypothetical protein D6827_03430 [Candidatus Parcubacteria bacterium]
MFSFEDSLIEEKQLSEILDTEFSKTYLVRPAPLQIDKLGIDRLFIHKRNKMFYYVEYKHDKQAHSTDNFFFEYETVTGDTARPSGIIKMAAQILVYHLPEAKSFYVIDVSKLKSAFTSWREQGIYQSVETDTSYSTESLSRWYARGLLVPIKDLTQPILIYGRKYDTETLLS